MLIRLVHNETWIKRIMKEKGLGLRVDDLASAMIYDAGNKNGLAKNNSSVSYLGNKNIKAIVEEREKVK